MSLDGGNLGTVQIVFGLLEFIWCRTSEIVFLPCGIEGQGGLFKSFLRGEISVTCASRLIVCQLNGFEKVRLLAIQFKFGRYFL